VQLQHLVIEQLQEVNLLGNPSAVWANMMVSSCVT